MKKNVLKSVGVSLLALSLFGCSSSNKAQEHARVDDAPLSNAGTMASKPRVDYKPIQAVNSAARASVVRAYEAMQRRQWDSVLSYANTAKADHELGAYPMYWYLRQQLSQTMYPIPTKDLQQFLQTNANTYLAERLKADWIVAAVRRADYNTALKLGAVVINHSPAQCAYYHALSATGKRVDAEQALSVLKNNEACWNMLSSLKSRGQVSQEQLRHRFRAAVEYDDKNMARRYAGVFFSGDALSQFSSLMDNPKAWLATQSGKASTEAQRELRALAFSRLARQDRDGGIAILRSRGAELLTPQDMAWAYTQFALVAVLNLENRADEWYRAGKDVVLSDYNAAWRVRAALRQPKIDWVWVEKAIKLMNTAQQRETAWVYWKARALSAQGKKAQANTLYASLNGHYDFYGQLAQEELHGKITLPEQAAPVSSKELAHIKQNTGLQRAVALFNLGWRSEAVAEWAYAIGGLNDRDLMAAAEWAREAHIYDRVINTSLLTKNSVNFKQRYIAPFEGRVGHQARIAGVNPSWVYGLIRQESRFVPVARSSVGASGLMQLMPGTARLVANKIGMADFSPSRVNEFEVNTILGTSYLRMTLDDLGGNEVLATAGYNAGPNRPKRWREVLTQPMEGAIFAETIPFTETRLYVKHVLSNAVWYDGLFNGQVQSLKRRLGAISGC